MKLFNHTRLTAAGITHAIIPIVIILVVAVGGTFMLVASHADSQLPTGKLVIYGTPTYQLAAIGVSNQDGAPIKKGAVQGVVDSTHAYCAGKKLRSGYRYVRISADQPTEVVCTASSLTLFFLQKGEKVTGDAAFSRQAPSVTTGYCTYVSPEGISKIAKMDEASNCPDAASIRAQHKKLSVDLKAQYISDSGRAGPIVIGDGYTQLIELSVPPQVLDYNPTTKPRAVTVTPPMCAGQVRIFHVGAGDPGRNYSIRYNARTKTCYYKQHVSAVTSAKLKPIRETLRLEFPGNDYLLPGTTQVEHERVRS
ncbi:MAG: hypothetical protein QFB86_00475 [Patescibacteria group bacterium]|nr:hypothetical protein [Patescibacteria group bacterium]